MFTLTRRIGGLNVNVHAYSAQLCHSIAGIISNMLNYYRDSSFPWRSAGAAFFFFIALAAFEMGVSVSERPEVADSGILLKIYCALSLFVFGGTDLGAPQGGTVLARSMLWLSYFGSPILAASTLIGAFLQALAPRKWYLRRLKNHVILVGDNQLTASYLGALRQRNKKVTVVVVCAELDTPQAEELKENYGALTVTGDITHSYFLSQLRVERAKKILLFGSNTLRGYEAASILTNLVPGIGERIVIHSGSLRFMRSMENTRVAKSCQTFNTYHLAATGLVRSELLGRFRETGDKDVVVIAGFGRFGQSILEELQRCAVDELKTVAIIDRDAHRRVMVAEEQMAFAGDYQKHLFEGDISHPEVWDRLRTEIALDGRNTVFVLGTGHEEENLRTALWIRRKYPDAMVISRSRKDSLFAQEVSQDHSIINVSISQLIEDNIPTSWIQLG